MKKVAIYPGTFDPITLAQMDEVSLMSRVDTKFVFNLDVFMAGESFGPTRY